MDSDKTVKVMRTLSYSQLHSFHTLFDDRMNSATITNYLRAYYFSSPMLNYLASLQYFKCNTS